MITGYPPTKENIAADKRLQRIYNITLGEYNERATEQGGVCAICKRPPKKFRLSVDHDHRFDRVKIEVHKGPVVFMWTAKATDPHGQTYSVLGKTRAEAKTQMKRILRKASWRGLLCFFCNKGLQFYRDIPERFDAAGAYLRKFNNEESYSNLFPRADPCLPPSFYGILQAPEPPQTSL